jgi:hypothetical protein
MRRQFVVYFCLHGGEFAGKRGNLASFSSEIKPRPYYDRGSIWRDNRETILSFGFPAVCNDRFNYRLDSAIHLLCGGNRLFDAIDHFQYITALLLFFPLFTFHFASNFVVLARRSFPHVLPSFLPFSL